MTPKTCLTGCQTKLAKFGVYPEDLIDGIPGARTDAAWAALQASFRAFSAGTGKMSTFGGPKDTGVAPGEGLWCYPDDDIEGFEDLFLPSQPPGTSGLARRLNPDKFYIACRWFGGVAASATNKKAIRLLRYVVSANGKSVQCSPCDWGPAAWTGRLCDISPGAAAVLGVDTDDTVSVRLA